MNQNQLGLMRSAIERLYAAAEQFCSRMVLRPGLVIYDVGLHRMPSPMSLLRSGYPKETAEAIENVKELMEEEDHRRGLMRQKTQDLVDPVRDLLEVRKDALVARLSLMGDHEVEKFLAAMPSPKSVWKDAWYAVHGVSPKEDTDE
jgi:intein/homing endonuclease